MSKNKQNKKKEKKENKETKKKKESIFDRMKKVVTKAVDCCKE